MITRQEIAQELTALAEKVKEEEEPATEQTQAEETIDWSLYPNFKPEEFKCPCGCGLMNMKPAVLDILQFDRSYYGKPVNIKSGSRCKEYNDSLQNSVKTSDHLDGKAADFQIPGITDTLSGREEVIALNDNHTRTKYSYCNGKIKYKGKAGKKYEASLMGKSVHISVK